MAKKWWNLNACLDFSDSKLIRAVCYSELYKSHHFEFLFFNFKINYFIFLILSKYSWSQCCVDFCCAQSDSVICIYILLHVLFHYGLSQDIEWYTVGPWYIVGPCCLSILYIVVCICQSKVPNSSLSHHPVLWETTSLFCMWVCFCIIF